MSGVTNVEKAAGSGLTWNTGWRQPGLGTARSSSEAVAVFSTCGSAVCSLADILAASGRTSGFKRSRGGGSTGRAHADIGSLAVLPLDAAEIPISKKPVYPR